MKTNITIIQFHFQPKYFFLYEIKIINDLLAVLGVDLTPTHFFR